MKLFQKALMLVFAVMLSAAAGAAAEGGAGSMILKERNYEKLEQIARFVAAELKTKGIPGAAVEPFTNFRSQATDEGREVAEAFGKILAAEGIAVKSEAEAPRAVIRGVIIPFKSGDRRQLKISVQSPETNAVIISYSGVYKVIK